MTDDELMVAVWADPDCPVQQVDPESWDGREGAIPWPRERIAIPARSDHAARGYTWHHRCRCRSTGSGHDWADPDDAGPIRPTRPTRAAIVTLHGRLWVENSATPQTSIVYLGQCADCGRIYWAIVGTSP